MVAQLVARIRALHSRQTSIRHHTPLESPHRNLRSTRLEEIQQENIVLTHRLLHCRAFLA